MKIFFPILLFSLFIAPVVSAQNSPSKNTTSKPLFSIDAVIPPVQFAGKTNYLLSLTGKDFGNGAYVFYTDSNATVAHIRINGNNVRLTGGPNAENIMAYTSKDYVVTLSADKNPSNSIVNTVGDGNKIKMNATLVVYTKTQSVGKKVTGVLINEGKN